MRHKDAETRYPIHDSTTADEFLVGGPTVRSESGQLPTFPTNPIGSTPGDVTQSVTHDPAALLPNPLQAASRAWAAAARDWHPAMTAQPGHHSRDLVHAGTELTQGWASITSPGQHWASGTEIAAHYDLGELLEHAAQDHRRATLTARDYTAAAHRILASGRVTIPNQLARAFTGHPSPTPRVTLSIDYAARPSYGTGRLTAVAEAARIALDTTTASSPAAAAARARLPLQMAAPDLDAAIRQRLDTLKQQRAHRAEQAKIRPASRTRPARGGPRRDDPPSVGPSPTPPGPRQH